MALDKIPFVIASSNKGKVKEFRNLLSDFPLEFIDQPEGLNVEEIGQTFEENARIKAIAANEKTGFLRSVTNSPFYPELKDIMTDIFPKGFFLSSSDGIGISKMNFADAPEAAEGSQSIF